MTKPIQFRDPLEILMKAEEKTCKGCVHREITGTKVWCGNPKQRSLSAEERCEHYEDSEQ